MILIELVYFRGNSKGRAPSGRLSTVTQLEKDGVKVLSLLRNLEPVFFLPATEQCSLESEYLLRDMN